MQFFASELVNGNHAMLKTFVYHIHLTWIFFWLFFTYPQHCLLMSQQLLANKHNRLRDSRLSLVWPSGGLGLVADKTTKNKIIDLKTALIEI